MAVRITEFVLDCADPERLAAFWCDVLGYTILARDEESVEIGTAGENGWTLLFSRSVDPKLEKLRLHIDVSATDRDQAAELARLLALGAREIDIGQAPADTWHVLADPEGNEFCLLRQRVDP